MTLLLFARYVIVAALTIVAAAHAWFAATERD